MTVKPVVPRARARQDIDDALDHYLDVAGVTVALRLVDAVEAAFARIGRHPRASAARYGHALDLPGLRTWPVRRFPYLLFYFDRDDHVDLWRVLRSLARAARPARPAHLVGLRPRAGRGVLIEGVVRSPGAMV